MPLWRGFAVGVGLDEQGEAAALDAVGDPGLGAVDHVVLAIAPGGRADTLQVGAGVGLRQRQSAAHLAARELGQPRLFLRLVPNFSIASASIRCELKMPVTAIQSREIRITILA